MTTEDTFPRKEFFFNHEETQIEFIKNSMGSSESFILKTELNTSKSSNKAGKIVKFATPVVSLGFSVLTVFDFGFSFINNGIMDKLQFIIISLIFAGIYLVPVAIALVILAAFVSMVIDGKKNTSKKFSCFVEIPEEIQKYLKFFNAEKIYEYSRLQEEASHKESELKDFQKLVKRAQKDFSFRKEAELKIERMKKEVETLKDMADQILLEEMNVLIEAEKERKIKEEVDTRLEVEELVHLQKEKDKDRQSEIETRILFELANDDMKDISERNAI